MYGERETSKNKTTQIKITKQTPFMGASNTNPEERRVCGAAKRNGEGTFWGEEKNLGPGRSA